VQHTDPSLDPCPEPEAPPEPPLPFLLLALGGRLSLGGENHSFGDTAVAALKDLSVAFLPRTFTIVMGPSGSGKSTLMHILAGLDRPTSGRVWIGSTEITGLGDKQLTLLRREQIGFVFQFFNLLPMFTAEENISLPLKIGGKEVDRAYLDQLQQTVIMVTHDAEAASIADRVVFLSDGHFVRDEGHLSIDQLLDAIKVLR